MVGIARYLFSGRANIGLARGIASELGVSLGRCVVENFPDDEFRVEILEDVRGGDIFLIQPTNPPVASHLLELLLLADACRRAGASRVIALTPYFGYARQDRRVTGQEPVGARLLSDLMSVRLDHVVTVDLHTPAIEGFFNVSVENLTAVPLLVEAVRPLIREDHVVVAPDLGAAKIAQRYAEALELPVAYLHKIRAGPEEVGVHGITGQVTDRRPLLVDDMISTGATMVSAVEALLKAGCQPRITMIASHGLFAGNASERFSSLPLEHILVTDSIPAPPIEFLPVKVVSLKGLLSSQVRRLGGQSG